MWPGGYLHRVLKAHQIDLVAKAIGELNQALALCKPRVCHWTSLVSAEGVAPDQSGDDHQYGSR
jgi:hypothetical protein